MNTIKTICINDEITIKEKIGDGPYSTLNISEDSTNRKIRIAFLVGFASLFENNTINLNDLRQLMNSYSSLINPKSRKEFDKNLKVKEFEVNTKYSNETIEEKFTRIENIESSINSLTAKYEKCDLANSESYFRLLTTMIIKEITVIYEILLLSDYKPESDIVNKIKAHLNNLTNYFASITVHEFALSTEYNKNLVKKNAEYFDSLKTTMLMQALTTCALGTCEFQDVKIGLLITLLLKLIVNLGIDINTIKKHVAYSNEKQKIKSIFYM